MKLLRKLFLKIWTEPHPVEPLKGKPVLKVMDKSIAVMEKSGVDYWCSAGTVLGLVREDKGYIDYDTDIDVEALVKSKYDIIFLSVLLEFAGFKLIRKMTYMGKTMQLAYLGDHNIIFDIYFYYDKGEYVENQNAAGVLRLPKHFIENKEWVKGYQCPSPVKEYLEYRYGEDWKIPTGKKLDWSETTGSALK